jgi:hypothetical protein
MTNLTVTTKLSLDDFKKINFYFLYRKRATKFSVALGTIMLLGILIPYIIGTTFFTSFPVFPLAIGLVLTLIPPLSILRNARRNYDSNKTASEKITYEFEKEFVSISGESFHSKLSWDKLYEVAVTKSWFLIWQSRQTANAIPRRDISDEQIKLIKDLLADNEQIKKSF